jgi:RNA polymerase sigma factor (sigma-70 family)
MSSDHSRPTFATRATLLLRLNTADPRRHELAWQEFHDRYAPVIAGFARNMHAKPHEIADIIQDVMLGFFANSPTFVYDPARGRFRGYLKTCTYRALRDRLRNSAKVNSMSLEHVGEEDARIEQLWDTSWQHELLNRAVNQVREEYANNNTFRAFEMHVLNAAAVTDVATALNMSTDAVYKAKQRVTAAVQRAFQQLQEEEG